MADVEERVVAEGGPLDGTEIDVAHGAGEFAVEMADRALHRYVRTSALHRLRSGSRGAVFRWAGRQ